jgi:hypothetical protein
LLVEFLLCVLQQQHTFILLLTLVVFWNKIHRLVTQCVQVVSHSILDFRAMDKLVEMGDCTLHSNNVALMAALCSKSERLRPIKHSNTVWALT